MSYKPESTTQIVKNSALISIFNVLGFVSALLIDMILAARFGLGQDLDAFFIAITIPKLVGSILLVVFNVVLVPIFSRAIIPSCRQPRSFSSCSAVSQNAILDSE